MSEERLLDLLADRATEGLSPSDQAELERLLAEHPEIDDATFDLAAAAIDRAIAEDPGSAEALPAALRARIEADAGHVLVAEESRPTARRAPPRRPRRWLGAVGWAAAAVLAGVLVMPPGEDEPPSTASLRAELLAGEVDVISVDWSPTGDAAGPEASDKSNTCPQLCSATGNSSSASKAS